MNRKVLTTLALAAFVALTVAVLGACDNSSAPEEPESKPCWGDYEDSRSWMYDDQLSEQDETTVATACFYTSLPLETSVTMGELRILEADFNADMECAFSGEVSDECAYRLEHELTIEEVRKGNTR